MNLYMYVRKREEQEAEKEPRREGLIVRHREKAAVTIKDFNRKRSQTMN